GSSSSSPTGRRPASASSDGRSAQVPGEPYLPSRRPPPSSPPPTGGPPPMPPSGGGDRPGADRSSEGSEPVSKGGGDWPDPAGTSGSSFRGGGLAPRSSPLVAAGVGR